MDDRDAPTRLRSLVYLGDGIGLVAALSQEPWPANSLQLIGDGLLAAVRDRTDGSIDLARECVNALRERRWDGDQELAEALDAALGAGPTPMLRRCRWTWRSSPRSWRATRSKVVAGST